MDTEISWTAKVGKKYFLARIKKPKIIFSFIVGLFLAIPLIMELISTLENDFNLSPSISLLVLIGLLVTLLIYTYKTNRLILGKNNIAKYAINEKGVTLNNILYLWSDYQYFQDEHLLGEKVKPAMLTDIKPDAYIITLIKKKYSDKEKLVLIMENQDTYEKVSKVVSSKLKDALNLK